MELVIQFKKKGKERKENHRNEKYANHLCNCKVERRKISLIPSVISSTSISSAEGSISCSVSSSNVSALFNSYVNIYGAFF